MRSTILACSLVVACAQEPERQYDLTPSDSVAGDPWGDPDPGDPSVGDDEAGDSDAGDPGGLLGDTCETAIVADLSGGSAFVTGTTIGAANDYAGPAACQICSSAPEAVVRMTVDPSTRITASLDVIDDQLFELTCMFFLDNCETISSPGGVLCGDTVTGTAEMDEEVPTGGTVYLFIDTEVPRDFELSLTTAPM